MENVRPEPPNPNPESGRNRRYFPRVNYRAHASLVTTHKKWPAHIIDLSFNGALAALLHKHTIKNGEEVVLTIETEGGEPIKMQGHITHQKAHFLGIECRANGIDHQYRLRELLGRYQQKEARMQRSLQSMIDEHRH